MLSENTIILGLNTTFFNISKPKYGPNEENYA